MLESRRLLNATWVTLSGPSGGSGPQGAPVEGDTLTYTVTYFWDSAGAPGGTVNINYGGTATPWQDYEILTSGVTIPSNPNYYPTGGTMSFTVPVKSDNLIENPETLMVSLGSNSSNIMLRPYGFPDYLDPTPYVQRTVTIADDPPIVSISKLRDGAEGGDSMQFCVARSGGLKTEPIPVSVLVDGQTYSVNVGWQATLDVPVNDDSTPEWTQTVAAQIQPGGSTYLIGTGVARAEVVDNDWSIPGLPDIIVVNNDDDDNNGIADLSQTGTVSEEDDLYELHLCVPGSIPQGARITMTCSSGARLWGAADRSIEPQRDQNGVYYWTSSPPGTLWVEATAASVVVGDIVLQLAATNPATTLQSPAQPVPRNETGWRLDGVSVTSGGGRDGFSHTGDFADDWVAVKNVTSPVVVEAAVTGPGGAELLPAGLLTWQNAEALARPKNDANVSRAEPTKKTVTAKIGNVSKKLDLWVIWATISIRTNGDMLADDQAPLRPGITRHLGAMTDEGGFPLAEATGKVEIQVTLLPAGIHTLLTGGFTIQRWLTGMKVINGTATQLNQPDVSPDYAQDLTPSDQDHIYDTDGPMAGACVNLDVANPLSINHTEERYLNFKQWVTWNGQVISDDAYWHWFVQIDDDLDVANRDVQHAGNADTVLNDLGTGSQTVPPKKWEPR